MGGASIDFDALTTKIVTGLTTHFTQTSITAWIYLDGFGEGDDGRILEKRTGGTQFYVWGVTNLDRLRITRERATQRGHWTTDAATIATGQWYHVAFSYDEGDTANDPVIYINGASVNVNEVTEPQGSVNNTSDAYVIGNHGQQDRTFDGQICYFHMWDKIITLNEVIESMYFPGSMVDSNLQLYAPMLDITDTVDESGKGISLTHTATANNTNGPAIALARPRTITYPAIAGGADVNIDLPTYLTRGVKVVG